MPPARAKKVHVSTTSDDAIPASSMIPTKSEGRHTPEHSSARQTAGITQAQKQALIDNFQLEITERARKLRAQLALQAQGLRARLEMRVNRIPVAMRKRTMQDLLDEYAEKARPAAPPPVPAKDHVVPQDRVEAARSPERKSLKRQSEHISREEDDKENAPNPESPQQDLPNPKKRAKTVTATANTKATRTVSRKGAVAAPAPLTAGGVLSPKSHNSRTLPRSPFKSAGASPEKPSLALPRAASPVKLSTHHLMAPTSKAAATRAPSRQQAKRAVPTPSPTMDEVEGRSSEASTTSAGTTIVTKPAAKGRPAAAKKAVASKTAGVGRPKAAATKKENVPPVTASGGRTLRKRG